MSNALRKSSDHEDYADEELAFWPGVTWERRQRSKHLVLVLTFNGVTRGVIYPATGSDRRGPLNHVRDIRIALRELGATRKELQKSAAPRRQRNRTEPAEIVIPMRDKTSLDRNPFDALAGFQCAEPVTTPAPIPPTIWQRLMAGFSRLIGRKS